MKRKARKQNAGSVSIERVLQQKQSRFNPIRNLTPENLARMIDGFHAGNLREFAMMMDAIERRDDVLQCVAPKRKKAVARREWEILTAPDLPKGSEKEAEAHKEALTAFYKNLEVRHAVEGNERGGFSLLVRQMLDAVGKKFAVHEILWRVTPEGELRATLQFVPLWFFENRTGHLRFLATEGAYTGEELEPGGWMVTTGDGIMEACAIAYMFKRLAVQAWVHYGDKHGTPGIQGKTDAEKGSERWNNLVEAVSALSNNFSCVTSLSDAIEKIDLSTTGELPYPGLVERMDRAMASLWRGADLGTISAGSGAGQGASLQGEETELLERDDAGLVSETLQMHLDRRVIEWTFGEGVEPLAYMEMRRSDVGGEDMKFRRSVWLGFMQDGTVSDIMANLTDLKALTAGVGLPVNEEYVDPYLTVRDDTGAILNGETITDAEGDIVGAKPMAGSAPQPSPAGPQTEKGFHHRGTEDTEKQKTEEMPDGGAADAEAKGEEDLANEAELLERSVAEALGVRARWLAPLKPFFAELEAALKDEGRSDEALLEFLEQAAKRLPELFGDLDVNALAESLEGALGTATVEGIKDAIRSKAEGRGVKAEAKADERGAA